jgi:hypothetical protein
MPEYKVKTISKKPPEKATPRVTEGRKAKGSHFEKAGLPEE